MDNRLVEGIVMLPKPVLAEQLTMVGCDENNGVLKNTALVEFVQQDLDLLIVVIDTAIVGVDLALDLFRSFGIVNIGCRPIGVNQAARILKIRESGSLR